MLYPNPQIYHHLKVIFVHVPKTAGTSIENRLRAHSRDVVGGHTTALAFRQAFPQHFDSYYKFAFVRHPLDRFLSAYRYLRSRPVHSALRNEIIHETGTLDAFLIAIKNSPAILSRIVHLLPAHDFICDSTGTILVDAVFKFEELDVAWRDICRIVSSRHSPLPKSNATHRSPAQSCDTEHLMAVVADVYARDFELFSYSHPSPVWSGNAPS